MFMSIAVLTSSRVVLITSNSRFDHNCLPPKLLMWMTL